MSSLEYKPYQSCLPTLFTWEERVYMMKDGKTIQRRRVLDKATGDVYMAHAGDGELRSLFALLAVTIFPLVGVVRIPLRISELGVSSFQSMEAAFTQATNEQHVAWVQWIKGKRETPPSELTYNCKIATYAIWNLAKEIIKIVTLPLASVCFFFAALYGIINPLDGRKIWGAIEYQWSRRVLPEQDSLLQRLTDFITPCMLPSRVWDESGLQEWRMKTFEISMDKTIRGMLFQIEKELRENELILTEIGIQVKRLLDECKAYRGTVLYKVSGHDDREQKKPTDIQKKHRLEWFKLYLTLTQYRGKWENEVAAAKACTPSPLEQSEAFLKSLTEQSDKINCFNFPQLPPINS